MINSNWVKKATEMRQQGQTWEAIAKHLNANGYTGRSGQPLTQGGVCTRVLRESHMNGKTIKVAKDKKSTARVVRKSKKNEVLIGAIMGASDLSPFQRLDLCNRIVGGN